MIRHTTGWWAAALGIAAGLIAGERMASACGCFSPPNPAVPIVQAGERILFAHKDGKVTAHIQIQYAGSSADAQEDFGWILPLPSEPGPLKLSTQELFDQLIDRTQPEYQLQVITDPSCFSGADGGSQGGGPSSGSAGSGGGAAGGPNSPLVLRDAVGPYDYAVLRADDKQAMFDWLSQNRFFVPVGTDSPNVIGPYIGPGKFFLALKLRSGQSAGDLQPVVVEYASDRPMIPLVLTSVAANPRMGVQVWSLGEHRAIPVNYRHTVLNEALLDWQNRAQNYLEVLRTAVNEVPQAQSFVTEYAGTSSILKDVLDAPERFGDLAVLRSFTTASDYVRYLAQHGYYTLPTSAQRFGNPGGPGGPFGPPQAAFDTVVRGILQRHIAMPNGLQRDGITPDQFYAQLEFYLTQYRLSNPEAFTGWTDTIDAAMTTAELDEKVVGPTRAAGQLFKDAGYLSRMFTYLDPEQMTKDPVFDFNPSLGEQPNVHTATLTISCLRSGTGSVLRARVLRLPNQRRLFFAPEDDGAAWTRVSMPNSQRIEVLPLEGAATIETDNTERIDRLIEERNKAIMERYDGWNWGPTMPPGAAGSGGGAGSSGGGGAGSAGAGGSDPVREKGGSGCSALPGAVGGSGALALLALSFLAFRRRRN